MTVRSSAQRTLEPRTRRKRVEPGEMWHLRLYVAGQTPRSTAALANLQALCEAHLPGRYEIEVVDLMKNPRLAREHQIVAVPTLIRSLPEPLKRIVGDLSNREHTLVGLNVERC